MNSKNKAVRGFTLTELTIVLAVLVIVSTMIVSFTVMVSNSRELSSARLDALDDVRVAEALIEKFIEGNKITTSFEDENKVPITVENKLESTNKSIEFSKLENDENKLVITDSGNVETTITLERVTKITFEYYGNNTDGIYYCTIGYIVGNHNYDYTFCVNPYVGENVGGN